MATQAQHKGMGWARRPNACTCHVSPSVVCGIAAKGANVCIAAEGAKVDIAAEGANRKGIAAEGANVCIHNTFS